MGSCSSKSTEKKAAASKSKAQKKATAIKNVLKASAAFNSAAAAKNAEVGISLAALRAIRDEATALKIVPGPVTAFRSRKAGEALTTLDVCLEIAIFSHVAGSQGLGSRGQGDSG